MYKLLHNTSVAKLFMNVNLFSFVFVTWARLDLGTSWYGYNMRWVRLGKLWGRPPALYSIHCWSCGYSQRAPCDDPFLRWWHSHICTVVATTQHRLSSDSNTASGTLTSGWLAIDWSWTWIRQSCSGLIRDVCCRTLPFHLCSLQWMLSQRNSTSECLELSYWPIDLSLKKHVTNVSATCFHHLRRLRYIRQMITAESAATLVHAFVTSLVDYSNVVLPGAQKVITNKLPHVMNAAARILAGTRKFDRSLTQLMHDNLHWLDVCLSASSTKSSSWLVAASSVPRHSI